ncbi:MAG: hypothetical protein GXZ02_10375 [Clostridiales bacterium]|nr:hypothetical protein [Clostridiales bacterium]
MLLPKGRVKIFCEKQKFREAVRLPFSKGIEHWGNVRRHLGQSPIRHKADYPLGERNALLIGAAYGLRVSKVLLRYF